MLAMLPIKLESAKAQASSLGVISCGDCMLPGPGHAGVELVLSAASSVPQVQHVRIGSDRHGEIF